MRILFVPFCASGHVNGMKNLGLALKARGHDVIYALEWSFAGQLSKYGIEEVILREKENGNATEDKVTFNGTFKAVLPLMRLKATEQFEFYKQAVELMLSTLQRYNQSLEEILHVLKPDLIVQDSSARYPSLAKSRIPIVVQHLSNPLCTIENYNLPPRFTGFPLVEHEEGIWAKHRQERENALHDIWSTVCNWLVKSGGVSLSPGSFHFKSTNLTLLMYPKPLFLHYLKGKVLESTILCVNPFYNESFETFKLPTQLESGPGKLIYMSLGTLGSADVELVNRLIHAAAKSRNRFIVSNGIYHDLYNLPANMWGQPYVSQLAVLPLVDLVITHGGNNTFNESLYFGKPMIVMPLFCDQFDNAQMAVEANIGLKFLPFEDSMDLLPKMIEHVLSNEQILANVKVISSKMKNTSELKEVINRIEKLPQNYVIPTLE